MVDCRSQCYEKSAVTPRELPGVQQRYPIRNPRASFVNCNKHSLNLAGLHATNQDPFVVTFLVQCRISMFSSALQLFVGRR